LEKRSIIYEDQEKEGLDKEKKDKEKGETKRKNDSGKRGLQICRIRN